MSQPGGKEPQGRCTKRAKAVLDVDTVRGGQQCIDCAKAARDNAQRVRMGHTGSRTEMTEMTEIRAAVQDSD